MGRASCGNQPLVRLFVWHFSVFALLILDQHRPVSQDMLNWPSNIELLRYQACRNRHKSRRIHRYFFQRRATTQASAKSRQNASRLFFLPFRKEEIRWIPLSIAPTPGTGRTTHIEALGRPSSGPAIIPTKPPSAAKTAGLLDAASRFDLLLAPGTRYS